MTVSTSTPPKQSTASSAGSSPESASSSYSSNDDRLLQSLLHEYVDVECSGSDLASVTVCDSKNSGADGSYWDIGICGKTEVLEKLIDMHIECSYIVFFNSVSAADLVYNRISDAMEAKGFKLRRHLNIVDAPSDCRVIYLVADAELPLASTILVGDFHICHFSTPFENNHNSAIDYHLQRSERLPVDILTYYSRIRFVDSLPLLKYRRRNFHLVPSKSPQSFKHVLRAVGFYEYARNFCFHSLDKEDPRLTEFHGLFDTKDPTIPKFQLSRTGIMDSDDKRIMKKFQLLQQMACDLDKDHVNSVDSDDPFI